MNTSTYIVYYIQVYQNQVYGHYAKSIQCIVEKTVRLEIKTLNKN